MNIGNLIDILKNLRSIHGDLPVIVSTNDTDIFTIKNIYKETVYSFIGDLGYKKYTESPISIRKDSLDEIDNIPEQVLIIKVN